MAYDWIEDVGAKALTQILGDLISAISEDCYSAGWYRGSEYIVPALCVRATKLLRPQPWAHGQVGDGLAEVLVAVSKKLGHWANLSDDGESYVPFDPWPTPEEYAKEFAYWRRKNR